MPGQPAPLASLEQPRRTLHSRHSRTAAHPRNSMEQGRTARTASYCGGGCGACANFPSVAPSRDRNTINILVLGPRPAGLGAIHSPTCQSHCAEQGSCTRAVEELPSFLQPQHHLASSLTTIGSLGLFAGGEQAHQFCVSRHIR